MLYTSREDARLLNGPGRSSRFAPRSSYCPREYQTDPGES